MRLLQSIHNRLRNVLRRLGPEFDSGRQPRLRRESRWQDLLPAHVQVLEQRQLLSVNAVSDTATVAATAPAPMPVQIDVLQNDSTDIPGGTLSIVSASGAQHGSLQIVQVSGQPDTIFYTPYMGYSGTDSFTYTDSDGTTTGSATVNLTVTPAGSAPTITSPGPQSTQENAAVALPLSISNPGNTPLTVTVNGLPMGLYYDSATNRILGQPMIGDSQGPTQGVYNVSVNASNMYGNAQEVDFTWTVTPAGTAPVITSPGPQSTQENATVALPLSISNPGNTPLTVTVMGLPMGLYYDSATNRILGQPMIGDSQGPTHGVYNVSVNASNMYGNAQEVDFTWTVTPAGTAPVITSPGPQSTQENAAASLPLSISNPGNTPLTVTVMGLPMGLYYDSATNRILGQPMIGDSQGPTHGVYNVSVNASNMYGNAQEVDFTWTVTPAGTAPVITSPGPQSTQENAAVSLPLSISNPGNTPLTVTVMGLPMGLYYDSATNRILGQPMMGDSQGPTHGVYNVSVNASNMYGNAQEVDFTWTVTAQNVAPVITPIQTSFTVMHDQTLMVMSPIVSGFDLNNDLLTLQLVTNVNHGTLFLNQDGTFIYAPNPHFTGSDAFQVEYVDPSGAASNIVTISLMVTNMPPVFSGGPTMASVDENTPIGTTIVSVPAADPDDTMLAYAITAGNDQGYFSIDAGGNIKVASNLDYEAMTQHQFTLTVQATDTVGAAATTTVTINVNDVNEPPVLQNFQVTTDGMGDYTFTGEVADETPLLCYIRFGLELDGHQVTCNLDGTFSYTVTITDQNVFVSATAMDSSGEESNSALVFI